MKLNLTFAALAAAGTLAFVNAARAGVVDSVNPYIGTGRRRDGIRRHDAVRRTAVRHDELDAADAAEQGQRYFLRLRRREHLRLHRHASASHLGGLPTDPARLCND